MKNLIIFTFIFGSTIFGEGSVFKTEYINSPGVGEKTKTFLNKLKENKEIRDFKIISINENNLPENGIAAINLFGNMRRDFKVVKDEKENIWRGSLGKFDCFVIRKVGLNTYSGFVYINGINYYLFPISKGKSVLYEAISGFKCGVSLTGGDK